MKIKIFIVSVFFVCCLLLDISLAQNKVVVIPLMEEVRFKCTGTLSSGGRWCDQNNGTILDMTTGLIWLKNAGWGTAKKWRNDSTNCGLPNFTCYNDAHTRAGLLKSGDSESGLNDGSIAGDWRLPTKTELSNLANGTEAVRESAPRYFTNVQSAHYWSSTSSTGVNDFEFNIAWAVSMTDGTVGVASKDGVYNVWPVRSRN